MMVARLSFIIRTACVSQAASVGTANSTWFEIIPAARFGFAAPKASL